LKIKFPNRLILHLKKAVIVENKEASIFRYSFSTSMVKIFPILLRLYAININPTSEPARQIPFFVRM
jgi:hypothetical protein